MERGQAMALKQQRLDAVVAANKRTVRALSCFDEAVMLCDVSREGWPVHYVNDQWCDATGTSKPSWLHSSVGDLFRLGSRAAAPQMAIAERAIAACQPFVIMAAANNVGSSTSSRTSTGSSSSASSLGPLLALEFRTATNDHLSQRAPKIGIPSFVVSGGSEGAGLVPSGFYFVIIRAQKSMAGRGEAGEAVAGAASVQHSRSTDISAGFGNLGPTTPCVTSHPSLDAESEATDDASNSQRGLAADHSEGSRGTAFGSPLSGHWEPHSYGMECPEVLSEVALGPMLGSGAYGKVFRGTWRNANVAVKIMDFWLDAGHEVGEDRQRVLEAALSKDLQHPNIVETYEFAVHRQPTSGAAPEDGMAGKQHQQVWIIQQLCTKGTLHDALDRGWLRQRRSLDSPPDMRAVLLTAQDISAALAFLHEHGVLHGDMHPGNVLLSDSPADPRTFQAKVSDFGLARVLAESTTHRDTESFGQVAHMPPELLEHNHLSKAADVYGMGVLLWEMYCAKHAWCGHRLAQIIHHKITGTQELPLPDDCPPVYKALVRSCMHRDLAQRPDMEQVLASINTLLAEPC